MGVRGLTRYIDNNPGLLKDHQLHDTRVIFDGNNLYHFLYNTYNLKHIFNGDYVNYAKKIKQVFLNLKKCNIHPVVIFDGGYNTDDRKHKTCLERARKRLRTSGQTFIGNSSGLLPILAYDTFRSVLDSLNVEHITCDYEADEHIAILANKWNCPIVSNDSDFYVYHINAGFLPMDYIDFRVKQKKVKDPETNKKRSQSYILVQIYHHSHYSDVLGKFDPKLIPLLATILGNDFVNGQIFSPFMSRFKRRTANNFKRTKRSSTTTAVVKWLQKQGCLEEAIESIVGSFYEEKRTSIEKTIRDSIASYMVIETSQSYLFGYLEDSQDVIPVRLKDFYGETLPDWIVIALLRAEISPFIQNAAVLRRVILQCQVEEFRKPSSHAISNNIRRAIYGILFSSRPVVEGSSSVKANRENHIEEYDRKTQNLGKTYTTAVTEIDNFGKVIDLRGLPIVDIRRRQEFILSVLSVSKNFVDRFRSSMQLLMSIVVYWARSAGIPKYHLAAYLLNILLLRLSRYCQLKDKEPEDCLDREIIFEEAIKDVNARTSRVPDEKPSIDDFDEKAVLAINIVASTEKTQCTNSIDLNFVFQSSNFELLALIKHNLTKDVKNLPNVSWKYDWPPRLSHCFAQLQSCILYSLNLNQLLLTPFEDPLIPESYDGSILFLLSKTMQAKENIWLYAAKMLGGDVDLFRLYKALVDAVSKEVGENNFVETYTMKRRRKKEEKELVTSMVSDIQIDSSSSSDDHSDDSSDNEDVDKIDIDCEVVNRFSLL